MGESHQQHQHQQKYKYSEQYSAKEWNKTSFKKKKFHFKKYDHCMAGIYLVVIAVSFLLLRTYMKGQTIYIVYSRYCVFHSI